MTDLLTIAEAQIAEKQVQEIQKIKERLEEDREVLKLAIDLVNTHTLYKVVSEYNRPRKYILATEEMLKQDYLKEPESYYRKGIQFLDDSNKGYNTGVLKVNGETYYDIRFALNQYEKRVSEKESAVLNLNSRIRELKDELENLNREFPSLKQAIQEWNEYQKKMEEENSDE